MGWTYYPFKDENMSKVVVRNKGKFKRGEGIADQKIKRTGWFGPGLVATLTLGVGVLAIGVQRGALVLR